MAVGWGAGAEDALHGGVTAVDPVVALLHEALVDGEAVAAEAGGEGAMAGAAAGGQPEGDR